MGEKIIEALLTIIISVIILFALFGFAFLLDYKEVKDVSYYENGIKIEAIEYNNEIYLKKGE